MSNQRKRHSSDFKSKVALEALKGLRTVNEIAGEHGIHPTQVSQWKKQLQEGVEGIFAGKRDKANNHEAEQLRDQLYQEIGRLKMELEWLKKKLPSSIDDKRHLIEPGHPALTIIRQCELVGLPRASYYYQAREVSEMDLMVMKELDSIYTDYPFFGARRMAAKLKQRGYIVNRKKIRNLMIIMGLEAIYPKSRLSERNPNHKIYPYLLREVEIVRVHQVWGVDITYIPMKKGFMYLVAIIDWYSRYVLAWRLSNTLDTSFCMEALEEALTLGRPEILNSDQGSQFTSLNFTERLEKEQIRISMDGRGRAFDNIFIERLWRSVKYEDVYIKEYATVAELEKGLFAYFHFYNYERPHQSLGYKTPAQVYTEGT